MIRDFVKSKGLRHIPVFSGLGIKGLKLLFFVEKTSKCLMIGLSNRRIVVD